MTENTEENPWKKSLVVHFDLILADKNTPPRTAAFEIIWLVTRKF